MSGSFRPLWTFDREIVINPAVHVEVKMVSKKVVFLLLGVAFVLCNLVFVCAASVIVSEKFQLTSCDKSIKEIKEEKFIFENGREEYHCVRMGESQSGVLVVTQSEVRIGEYQCPEGYETGTWFADDLNRKIILCNIVVGMKSDSQPVTQSVFTNQSCDSLGLSLDRFGYSFQDINGISIHHCIDSSQGTGNISIPDYNQTNCDLADNEISCIQGSYCEWIPSGFCNEKPEDCSELNNESGCNSNRLCEWIDGKKGGCEKEVPAVCGVKKSPLPCLESLGTCKENKIGQGVEFPNADLPDIDAVCAKWGYVGPNYIPNLTCDTQTQGSYACYDGKKFLCDYIYDAGIHCYQFVTSCAKCTPDGTCFAAAGSFCAGKDYGTSCGENMLCDGFTNCLSKLCLGQNYGTSCGENMLCDGFGNCISQVVEPNVEINVDVLNETEPNDNLEQANIKNKIDGKIIGTAEGLAGQPGMDFYKFDEIFVKGENYCFYVPDMTNKKIIAGWFDQDFDVLSSYTPCFFPKKDYNAGSVYLGVTRYSSQHDGPVDYDVEIVRGTNEIYSGGVQKIYLNFNGGKFPESLKNGYRDYCGKDAPEEIPPFDICEYSPARCFFGLLDNEQFIRTVSQKIRTNFAGFNLEIYDSLTSAEPPQGNYSEVYYGLGCGGTPVLGMSNAASLSNQNQNVGQAIIFTDVFGLFGWFTPTDRFISVMASVTSHEMGHLFDLTHTYDSEDIMGTADKNNWNDLIERYSKDQKFKRAPLFLDGYNFPGAYQDSVKSLNLALGPKS